MSRFTTLKLESDSVSDLDSGPDSVSKSDTDLMAKSESNSEFE